MKYKRFYKNFLIDPQFQIEFAALLMLAILSFICIMGWFSYLKLQQLLSVVMDHGDVTEALFRLVRSELNGYFYGMLSIMGIFALSMAGVVIFLTHRIAGAKYAIVKYIKECLIPNKIDRQLILRKNDYLKEIASELNRLGQGKDS